MSTAALDEGLWTKRDVAKFLRVDVRTVERLPIPRIPIPTPESTKPRKRPRKGPPRPIVRYDPDQVKAWLDTYRTRKLTG